MTKLNNLIGRRFGRLIVVSRAENDKRGRARWVCKCDCGNTITTSGTCLLSGSTTSCKCYYIESRTGNNNPAKRPEVRAKISLGLMGRPYSEETRAKISASRTGSHVSEETKRKISKSIAELLKDPVEIEKRVHRGKDHPNWKGGITCKTYCEKWNKEFRNRIRAFFEYRCLMCGKSQEDNKYLLTCHHVFYNKNACCDDSHRYFAALCISCHMKTNYNTARWENMLKYIIDEMYNGKSYYTKEEYAKLDKSG